MGHSKIPAVAFVLSVALAVAAISGCIDASQPESVTIVRGRPGLATPVEVKIKTDYGAELFADYYRGRGKNPPAVLLLHDLGRDRRAWDPIVKDIVEQGYAVLALDVRGHGKSTKFGDETMRYEDRETRCHDFWRKENFDDIDASVKFLESRSHTDMAVIAPEYYAWFVRGEKLESHIKGVILLVDEPQVGEVPDNDSEDTSTYEHKIIVYDKCPTKEVAGIKCELEVDDPDQRDIVKDVLRKRSDEFGLKLDIEAIGTKRILILAPEEMSEDIDVILSQGVLELKQEARPPVREQYAKDVQEHRNSGKQGLPDPPDGYEVYETTEAQIGWILVEEAPLVTGAAFKRFYPTSDRQGQPVVGFDLYDREAARFGEVTEELSSRNPKGRLAIIVNGKLESAPVVQTAIKSGSGVVSFGGSRSASEKIKEQRKLLIALKSGSLPVPIKVKSRTSTPLFVRVKPYRTECRIKGPRLGTDILGKTMKLADGDEYVDVNKYILKELDEILNDGN